jgi:hypothetical protein
MTNHEVERATISRLHKAVQGVLCTSFSKPTAVFIFRSFKKVLMFSSHHHRTDAEQDKYGIRLLPSNT